MLHDQTSSNSLKNSFQTQPTIGNRPQIVRNRGFRGPNDALIPLHRKRDPSQAGPRSGAHGGLPILPGHKEGDPLRAVLKHDVDSDPWPNEAEQGSGPTILWSGTLHLPLPPTETMANHHTSPRHPVRTRLRSRRTTLRHPNFPLRCWPLSPQRTWSRWNCQTNFEPHLLSNTNPRLNHDQSPTRIDLSNKNWASRRRHVRLM